MMAEQEPRSWRGTGDTASGKGRRRPVETLAPGEVWAMLRAASKRWPSGVRNRALLVVMYRGGLRVGEALALEWRDVDPNRGTVHVRAPKGLERGAEARLVPLDPGAWEIVGAWRERRRALGIPRRGVPFFCTLQGGPLSDRYVRSMLRRLAERAHVERRVHPHALRHTFATELALEGVPVHVIQQLLGHRDLATTQQYLRQLAPADLIALMQQRRWAPAAPEGDA